MAVAHTLRGEGFDASEDGTGRGTPLIPCVYTLQHAQIGRADNAGPQGKGWQEGIAFTQDSRSSADVVAFDTTQITSAAKYSNPKAGDPCHPLAAGSHAIAFHSNAQADQLPGSERDTSISDPLTCSQTAAVCVGADMYNGAITGQVAATLGTQSGDGVSSGPSLLTAMQVRRLTPEECEKLQGFLPGFTQIPWLKKPADRCPDGPRYKALGNSMAVPVMRWIGRQIDTALLFQE